MTPTEPTAGRDALWIMAELNDIVSYHREMEQAARTRTAGAWHREHGDTAQEAVAMIQALAERVRALTEAKDGAYLERNRVVALLARLFPSGVARTAIEGWSDDWHGCVYIDLPTGQVSWHFHDSHAFLFEGLPPYRGTWDGHTTQEKYERVAALRPGAPSEAPNAGTIPAV